MIYLKEDNGIMFDKQRYSGLSLRLNPNARGLAPVAPSLQHVYRTATELLCFYQLPDLIEYTPISSDDSGAEEDGELNIE